MPITERTVVSTGTMGDPYDLGYGRTYSVPAGNQNGGAVYVESTGVASGTSLTFSGNGVTTEAGKGGAIYNAGWLLLYDDTVFSSNSVYDGASGAVYNAGTGKFVVSDTVTLSTGTDTVYNEGTMLWNLVNGVNYQSKVVNYEYVTNATEENPVTGEMNPVGKMAIVVAGEYQENGTYVLATGNLSDAGDDDTGKYEFYLTDDGESFSGNLDLGGTVWFSDHTYTLTVVSDATLRLVVADGDHPHMTVSDATCPESEGLFTITLNIDGESVTTYAGDGGVFTVESTGTLKNESGITIKKVKAAGNGGAISSVGKLDLNDITFEENYSSSANGGAISITGGTENTIKNATFVGNAIGDVSASTGGGAIYMENASLTLENVLFTTNSSSEYGGAIYAKNSTLNISDDTAFNSNVAWQGGAINADTTTLNLTNVSFTENEAENGGGAIMASKTSVVTLDGVTFDGNNGGTEGGGAICLYDSAQIKLTGSVTLATSTDTILFTWPSQNMTWVISDTDSKNGYLNNYSLIGHNSAVTSFTKDNFTIDAEDALQSEYTLAGNAATADGQEFTIITADGTSQTITVNGDAVTDAAYGTKYTLATVAGTSGYDLVLSVEKKAITITANDATKMYDGTALTEDGYTITEGALIGSDELTVTMTDESTITKVGTADNVIDEYKVMRGSEDVTKYYDVTTADGTLEVTVNDQLVNLRANSASKMYDGAELTDYGYTWTGLGTGDAFTDVVISGSQTHAGSSVNGITSYKVTNAAGEDVAFCYSNIQTHDGTLEVTKRDVTIASGFADKYYDGTPLTNDTITVSGSGFVGTEGATYDVTGSQTKIGVSENTFTYEFNDGTLASDYDITQKEGVLTVFPDPTHIIITADSNTKMYDGSALTDSGYTVTGDLEAGDTLVDVVVAGSITNAGTAANEVISYRVVNGAGEDVTDYYTNIWTVDGTLEITQRDVTLTSGSASKMYDGTPLTNSTVTVSGSGFVGTDGATYDVTGSQTYVGSSDNTFSYTLNDGTLAGNYAVTTVEGELEVFMSDRLITITADSASKMYDGTALTDSGYTYTGDLVAGDYFASVTVEGSITDAGTAVNTVTGWVIMNAAGDDVTDDYSNIQTADGTLSVTKRDVTLTSATDIKKYDGTPLTNDTVTVTGSGWVNGEGAAYDVTGSQTKVGSSANTFSYTLNEGTKADNYAVTTEEGTLTVVAGAITDYNASGRSDMIQFVDGLVYVTYDTEDGYVQTPAINDVTGWDVVEVRRDLTGDGLADIQITSDDGCGSTWVATLRNDYLKDGAITLNYQFIGAYDNLLWEYIGSADVNGDGKAEVLMEQTVLGADAYGHRNVAAWVTDETGTWVDNDWVGGLSTGWDVAGTADIDGDGTDNVILRHASGTISYWDKAGTNEIINIGNAQESVLLNSGDFDGDSTDDLLFANATGDLFVWSNITGDLISDVKIGNVHELGDWELAGAGDYNGDGKDELLWCDGTNTAYSEANKENFSKLIQIA